MAFQFIEATHTYLLNGQEIPGVTTVIKPLYNFEGIPKEVLENKADWGRKVHSMVRLHIDNQLDDSSISESLHNVLMQFVEFSLNEGQQFPWVDLFCETPMYSARLKYAGRPDLMFPEDVIDIKTRDYDPVVDPLQCMAYDRLAVDHIGYKKKKRHWILSLFEDRYVLKPIKCSVKQPWERFRYLLGHYWATHEYNQKLKIWKGQ